MSLRPRYSLLTLLVLTALVAGGVKLWYGPHHIVVSESLTIEELALFNDLAWSDSLQEIFAPVVYEYEFTNEWHYRNYHFVKGSSKNPRPIPIYQDNIDPQSCFLLRQSEPTKLILEHEHRLAKREYVINWIYPMKSQDKSWIVADHTGQDTQTTRLQASTRCYFLTNRKKLYGMDYLEGTKIMLTQVELMNIDPKFREIVVREFANIPEPQFP